MTERWLTRDMEAFFTQSPALREKFKDRHRYYHQDDERFFRKAVPPDASVLIIGCDIRSIAETLPARVVYVYDLGGKNARQSPASHIRVVNDLSEAFQNERIDYVLLPYTVQLLEDVQAFMESLAGHLTPETRVIILQYNFLWAPVLKLAQRLGLKTPYPDLNWLNRTDIRNMAVLCGYQEITSGARCLIPIGIPWLSDFVNRSASSLPFLAWLCQKTYAILRYYPRTAAHEDLSVTIVVPARNEMGNIGPLIARLPTLGKTCEIIFVEGHSTDDTWGEIQRQVAAARRPGFTFQTFQQTGKGKADAVRLGFSHASGDALMILDADLSVQPEDLRHFYDAFTRHSAEFLNGSRLVYDMEKQAMQLMNLFFNKVFGILISWLIGQPVKDTLCGTKVIYRQDYERIRKNFLALGQMDPFGDFELLFGASRLNLKICDVPVRYKERVYGTTNIRRWRHGWELLKMLLAGWKEMK